jgi:hypothetical protein
MSDDLDDVGEIEESESTTLATKVGTFIAFLLVVAVPVFFIWMLVGMFPENDPQLDPADGWLSAVFSDKYVIYVARIAVLAAAVAALIAATYVASSVIVRMRRGHWLSSGFGLHAEVVEQALYGVDVVNDLLVEAQQEKDRLTELLSDAYEQLEAVTQSRAELIELLMQADEDPDGGEIDEQEEAGEGD